MSARRLAVLGLALGLTALTMLPLCDLIFDCGCTWPFAGAADRCNIHHPRPPHCPLCASWAAGGLFAATLFVGWAGALGLLSLMVWPRGA